MPGTPASSPNFDAPRWSDADDCSFSEQVNGVTDVFDGLAVRNDDPRLSDQRTPPDGSITTAKLANAAVTGAKVAATTITEANLAPDSVGAPEIIAGSVGSAELAASAVTTGKVAASAITTGGLADGAATLPKIDPAVQAMLFSPGDLKLSAAANPPTGWLLCDGSAVSRTTYAALFAALGTAYGSGDGSATFNLPDFRGRTLVGAGAGPGLTARTRGTLIGGETHTHTVPGLAVPNLTLYANTSNHSHTLSDNGGAAIQSDGSGVTFGDTGPGFNVRTKLPTSGATTPGGSHSGTGLVGSTDVIGNIGINGVALGANTAGGTSGSSPNMPPAAVANVFVKT